ncbi:MAG: DUF554 domain-containing protein [Bacteroidaceae bacterium]|nr:DUF554 domain-containing protein [Bacteroidaceae bacterium]
MLGTIVNTCAIMVGSIAGSFLKRSIKGYQEALFNALGVCTILLGANSFVRYMPKSEVPVLFIVSMAIGTVIGHALNLNGKFYRLVEKLKKGDGKLGGKLGDGLSTGILLYCIGTFSMLGPVLSALQGDNTYLYTNATLDLVTSMVLASTYGIGMIWAAPVLFCWQGMFYAIAKFSESAISEALVCELSIVGGVLIAVSGFNILELKHMKTINMLPSLLVPPIYFLISSIINNL